VLLVALGAHAACLGGAEEAAASSGAHAGRLLLGALAFQRSRRRRRVVRRAPSLVATPRRLEHVRAASRGRVREICLSAMKVFLAAARLRLRLI
jgi:hypothetical protein